MSGRYIVSPQHLSEEMLVSAAQSGTHRAIEHLIITHHPIRSLIATLKRRMDPNGRATDPGG